MGLGLSVLTSKMVETGYTCLDLLNTHLKPPRHSPDTIDVVRHPLDIYQVDSRHPSGTLLTPKALKIAFN